MYRVSFCRQCEDEPGEEMVFYEFATEREARAFINMMADGSCTYSLWHDGEFILRSSFPVLMVA